MRQVLFYIPLNSVVAWLPDVPIYGYGAMLFLAFLGCAWLAARLGEREGISKERMYDITMWIFISGLIGARITFMIQYWERFQNILQFFAVWDGGLVFYGSFIGGFLGFFLGYFLVFRKYGFSPWKIVDVAAPNLALGLALGRIGCLLNGCCFGNVACVDCPAVHFPLSSPPRFAMVERGYQTAAGFLLSPEIKPGEPTVSAVEPDSAADEAGLRAGDQIIELNGKDVASANDLYKFLFPEHKQRGQNEMQLTVRHADGSEAKLPTFYPRTLGLHPTQIYETISMILLLFVLLSYYPFKRRDGAVMVVFMLAYAVHRYLNEMLRTDTDPVAFGLTLSQNISILCFAVGAAAGIYLWRRPLPAPAAPAAPSSFSGEPQATAAPHSR